MGIPQICWRRSRAEATAFLGLSGINKESHFFFLYKKILVHSEIKPSISHSVWTSLLSQPNPRPGSGEGDGCCLASCYAPSGSPPAHSNHCAAPGSSGHRKGEQWGRESFYFRAELGLFCPVGVLAWVLLRGPCGDPPPTVSGVQEASTTYPWTSGDLLRALLLLSHLSRVLLQRVTLLGVLKSGYRVLSQLQGNINASCPTTLRAPAAPLGTCRCAPQPRELVKLWMGPPALLSCLGEAQVFLSGVGMERTSASLPNAALSLLSSPQVNSQPFLFVCLSWR